MEKRKDICNLNKASRGYILRPKKDERLEETKKKLENTPYKVPKFRDNSSLKEEKERKLKDSGFSKPKGRKNKASI